MSHPDHQEGAVTWRVHVLTSASELDEHADLWHSLWNRCEGVRTPYLSVEYVRTWVTHYGCEGRLHIIVVEDDQSIVGIMPLTTVRYGARPFALEVLETVGGESRNLIALVAPGADMLVARAVVSHLRGGVLSRRRLLRLTLIPSDHPFLAALVQALASVQGIQTSVRTVTVAPYVPLPALYEDFERSLGRRRRKYLGRLQRRRDRSHQVMRVHQAQADDVDDAMRGLFRLHEARWRAVGIRGLFRGERRRAFHLDLARVCDRLGWLDLSAMTIDGVVVSVHFVLVLDGVAYLMRSGRDTSFAEYGIGHLHELRSFRRWIAEGLREADLLRGSEPYKFYWTRNYRVYAECVALRGTVAGSLSLLGARAWIWLARFIAHRHPPREILAYLRTQHAMKRELSAMGVKLPR
ncbi:MAG: GNAT family N-acetyltransferase [Dehalococcoidia bacterium]|nr:MAG: GNAT family N-acetyltransferase [Dehalococcoidia bacterium]